MRIARYGAILGAAALAVSLTACGGAASSGGGSSAGGEGESVNGIDTANCPEGFNTVGISDTEVKIGSSNPLSGPVGGVGGALVAGLNAYIEKVNDAGGVEMKDGKTRKITNTVLDDGYEPARARSNADQLINGDGVFSLVINYGTPGNLSARPILMETCTPSIWMTSGHNEFGNPEYPWLAAPIAGAYSGDALSAATFILEQNPKAKIAVLKQNDDLGNAFLAAFENGLEGTDASVVAEATFEPTDSAVSAQITTLAGSGATDFVMLAGAGTYQLQALEQISQSSWDPGVKYMTNFSPPYLDQLSPDAATDVYFGQYFKSPKDPSYADDPVVKEYVQYFTKQPGTGAFPIDTGLLGWQAGVFLEETLKTMDEPTKLAFVDAATHMTWDQDSAYLDGIKYSINWPDSPYGVQSEVIVTYDPNGPAGRKFKQVKVIDNTGKVKFEDLG